MKVYTYNPEEFIDRENELKQVINEALKPPSERKVILFKGGRGSGKSWLMTKLFLTLSSPDKLSMILDSAQQKAISKIKLKPFFIGMFPLPITTENKESVYETTFEQGMDVEEIPLLASKIIEYFKLTRLQEFRSVLDDQSRYLARDLSELPIHEIPIFIIDSIFEASEKTRAELEKYILSPILRSQHTVVVISGRGSQPIWSSPELREPVAIELRPFNEDEKQAQVTELLRKIKSPHLADAALIYELSGGYPLTIRLLGRDLRHPLESLNDVIQSLLSESLPNLSMETLKFIRNYLEKLSVIINTAFRDREVAPILFSDSPENESLVKAGEIREILRSHSLIEYRDGGHIINPSILIPIKGYLKYKETRQWKTYQDKAVNRFHQLSIRYEKNPDTKKYYQDLVKKINANNEPGLPSFGQ